MVQDAFIVAVFFGFVPAMGFLYILLREYEPFFSEKRMFRTFFVGMIGGAVLTLLEAQFGVGAGLAGLSLAGAAVTGTVFAVLLGLLEALAFTAVLNWRAYRGRRDTPFYGLAFGLGFGATSALFRMFLVLQQEAAGTATAGLDVWARALIVSVLGLFLTGGILVHGAMGAWIGQGTGAGPLPRWVARAAAVRVLYEALYYAMLLAPPLVANALAVLGVAFGIALTARVLGGLLDHVVPPEVLREMGIHRRRVGRRILRDEPPRP